MHFFLFDTVKITLLLTGIIFAVTVLRSFVTLERTRALLGGRREGVGNVTVSGFGVVTPFCSCSAVPAFLGFVAAGVPLGVTLSFLIASPLVNEVAVVLLYGLFGFRIAALYVVSGLTIAVIAGFVLGRLRLERWVEPFVFETKLRGQPVVPGAPLGWDDRAALGRAEVRKILGRIWPYLGVGIGLGAVIHGWVPTEFFARYAGPDNPFAPLVAVVLGVPLYSNAAGVLPLIEALHAKGLAMGTLLAFMMAVVALSLPEMILLRRVLKPQLLACFVGVVGLAILATDYVFNLVLQPKGRHSILIKILGSGCKDCEALEQSTREALAELNVDADIGHVTDYAAIAGYGVMSAPALVVDEQVVLAGRVPTAAQVRARPADPGIVKVSP